MKSITKTYTTPTYTPSQREALERLYLELEAESDGLSCEDDKHELKKKKFLEVSQSTGLSAEQIRLWIRNRKLRGGYKGRVNLAVEQVRVLEWVFQNHSKYPTSYLKAQLAKELSIQYPQVQKWFKTRRQRGAPAILKKIENNEDSLEWQLTIEKLKGLVKSGKFINLSEGETTCKNRKRSISPDSQPLGTGFTTEIENHPPPKKLKRSSGDGGESLFLPPLPQMNERSALPSCLLLPPLQQLFPPVPFSSSTRCFEQQKVLPPPRLPPPSAILNDSTFHNNPFSNSFSQPVFAPIKTSQPLLPSLSTLLQQPPLFPLTSAAPSRSQTWGDSYRHLTCQY